MAYQIFRIEKMKRQAVGGLQAEHNRTEADRGRFPDSAINYDRTHNNVYLLKSRDYWKDIQKCLKQHKIEKWRKDAVVMLDAIYTASPEALERMSETERVAYFQECAEWHQENIGPIINAVIHKDETSWHLHVDSVPIMQKEDGSWKLCAKDIIGNRENLSKLQTSLHEKVSRFYNLERGESREPGEQRKHKSKLEHELELLEKKESDCKEQLASYEERTQKAQEQAEVFERGAQRRLEALESAKAELKHAEDEISAISGEKRAQEIARGEKLSKYKRAPLSKDMYLVPEDDILAFENMENTGRKLYKRQAELESLEKDLRRREQQAENAYNCYEKYPGMVRKLREREEQLEAEAEKKAGEIFQNRYEGALREMGLYAKVKAFIQSKSADLYRGWER